MNLDRIIAVRNDRTVYKDGNDCIKVFCDCYPKEEVLSEAFCRALAEKFGLPVPKLKAVTTVEGKWAIISEYVRGRSMSKLMAETPQKSREYIEKLIKLQKDILACDGTRLPRLADRLKEKISSAELDSAKKSELIAKLSCKPYETHLCHGDMCPSNVIIAEDGKLYVIDWDNATSGSVYADAATAYLYFVLQDQPENAEEYLRLFAGDKSAEVLDWVPIIAAATLNSSHSLKKERLLSVINAAI